ncbi:MAG: hypothetical protein RR741_08970 [Erysipelotrichaceae bacterium]
MVGEQYEKESNNDVCNDFCVTIGVVSVSAASKSGGTWNYGVGITGS